MSNEAISETPKTLASGIITQGQRVEELECTLHNVFKHPYILTLNSATSGLTLALRLLENKTDTWCGFDKVNDVVLTTPLTCTATNWSILANGMNIQWVDTNPQTCNILCNSKGI